MRLNKFLAHCGVASRREADRLIQYGLVQVNGQVMTNPAYPVDPQKDEVRYQKKRLYLPKLHYFAFYKPKYMITTLKDPEGRPCVGDVLGQLPGHLFPIGRLDWQSEGLLFLTNDGDWAQKVMHPRFKVPKIYHVKVKGTVSQKTLDKMVRGITWGGKKYSVQRVKPLDETPKGHTWLEVLLYEGKSRHIRILMEKLGHPVQKLKRIKIGIVGLGKLKPGGWRKLTPSEIQWFSQK